jgi:hypothetical protein
MKNFPESNFHFQEVLGKTLWMKSVKNLPTNASSSWVDSMKGLKWWNWLKKEFWQKSRLKLQMRIPGSILDEIWRILLHWFRQEEISKIYEEGEGWNQLCKKWWMKMWLGLKTEQWWNQMDSGLVLDGNAFVWIQKWWINKLDTT